MIERQLETNRLVIRRINLSDCESIHRYMSRPDVVRFLPEAPLSLDDVKEHQRKHLDKPLAYAVCLKVRPEMIGHIVFHKVFNCYTYEIGWVFHPDFCRLGYATEAALKVIEYGFKELKLHRIIATCHSDNSRSLKMMARLGMRREGHFKEAILRDERWVDEYLYALLWKEFLESVGDRPQII